MVVVIVQVSYTPCDCGTRLWESSPLGCNLYLKGLDLATAIDKFMIDDSVLPIA